MVFQDLDHGKSELRERRKIEQGLQFSPATQSLSIRHFPIVRKMIDLHLWPLPLVFELVPWIDEDHQGF